MPARRNALPALILTCEHGGNRVPAPYGRLFARRRGLLATHRAFDRGALSVARSLARRLGVPLLAATTSRLLVDLNRSADHPALFSAAIRALPPSERAAIRRRYYEPYRRAVERWVARRVRTATPVVHVAVHSFAPVLRGRRRPTRVGLLFDPARRREASLCAVWREELRARRPRLRVHHNRPYRGTSDGLTSALRRRFPAARYLGIELELNQALLRDRAGREALAGLLAETLAASLGRRRGEWLGS